MRQSLTLFLDQIRNKIKLSDLIAEETQVIRKGKTIKALCPFHNEKTPSFGIDDQRGVYHCFGCNAGGDHFSFVMNTKNLEFMEACEYLADKVNIVLPSTTYKEPKENLRLYELLEKTCTWYQEQLLRNTSEHAQTYLEKRKISTETIQKFRLGYAPSSGLLKFLKESSFTDDECVEAGVAIKGQNNFFEKFKNRLMFPILSHKGQVIAFGGRILGEGEPKYLNSPETPVFKKRHVLYGFDKARKYMRTQGIIVEGYLDVIKLHQEGLPIAVAPLGTALTIEQLQQLWKIVPMPIIAFDGDSAGLKAAYNAMEKALPYIRSDNSLKFLILPENEDPDSLVKNYGINKFKELMVKATHIYEMIWQHITSSYNLQNISPEEFINIKKSLKDYLMRIQNKNLQQAYVKKFDGLLNQLQTNDLTTLTIPGHSKLRPKINLEKKISPESILMVTLLNHPYIWEDVSESFINMAFSNEDEEKARLSIIEGFLNNIDFLTNEWPKECENLKKMNDSAFYTRVPFAKIGYDRENVEKGWQEVYINLSGRSIESDSANFADYLKNNFTLSNWERLKALKKL